MGSNPIPSAKLFKMTNEKYIESFKKKYGKDLYAKIEKDKVDKKFYHKKDKSNTGIIKYLWLPEDIDSYRKNHLWFVKWDSGGFGILEDTEIGLTC